MGNFRFGLSDMTPNTWLYKLKSMGRSRSRSQNTSHTIKKKQQPETAHTTTTMQVQQSLSQPRHSDYFPSQPIRRSDERFYTSPINPKASDTHFPEVPRKSSRRRTIGHSSKLPLVSSGKFEKLDEFHTISEPELPRILTKPTKFKEESIKSIKERRTSPPIRRASPNSPGLKLRTNSPRVVSRKIQACSRASVSSMNLERGISESFAVVKSSFNPQRDFRDSMVEMIVENNIWESKDLEELLACYLSLNSIEYHDLIVKVFEQIWLDPPRIWPLRF